MVCLVWSKLTAPMDVQVVTQPKGDNEILRAAQALLACPT